MVCPICSDAHATESATTSDARIIDCPQCGNFTISGRAIAVLNIPDNFATERWKISAWVNEYKPTRISPADLETARNSSVPSLHHRSERMLRWLAGEFPPGKNFDIKALQDKQPQTYFGRTELMSTGASKLIPIGWNKDIIEMSYMLKEVLSNELKWLVQEPSNASLFQISPKGLLYLEGRRESISSVGFCAMWFNPSVRFIYDEAISKAIKDAGYEPFRVDGKEHNNRIDDEIVANIKSAKFMVADLTGHRGGVYYEAGLAHGLGLEVIFTCKEKRATHFDIRQYNTIFWNPDNMPDFREKIKNRILASSIGRGPLDPNRA